MSVVITFDVSGSDGSDVTHCMIQRGYYNYWSSSDTSMDDLYYLPKGILWKKSVTFQEAMNDLKSVIREINQSTGKNLDLVRCICLPANPWFGMKGTPY